MCSMSNLLNGIMTAHCRHSFVTSDMGTKLGARLICGLGKRAPLSFTAYLLLFSAGSHHNTEWLSLGLRHSCQGVPFAYGLLPKVFG